MIGSFWRKLVLALAAALLSGCVMPAGSPAPPTITLPPAADPASPTPPAEPSAPVVLLEQPTAAGSLRLLRYEGAQGACLAVTFDPQTLAVTRCGAFAGGVGFVDSLTDPAGQTVRVAFGLAGDPAATAVAIEFAGGGNAPATVRQGGYLLILAAGQTPLRATAIDQYGYMVGQWRF